MQARGIFTLPLCSKKGTCGVRAPVMSDSLASGSTLIICNPHTTEGLATPVKDTSKDSESRRMSSGICARYHLVFAKAVVRFALQHRHTTTRLCKQRHQDTDAAFPDHDCATDRGPGTHPCGSGRVGAYDIPGSTWCRVGMRKRQAWEAWSRPPKRYGATGADAGG